MVFQGHEESREIKENVVTTENLEKRENVEPKVEFCKEYAI